jgi:hypothetical protein
MGRYQSHMRKLVYFSGQRSFFFTCINLCWFGEHLRISWGLKWKLDRIGKQTLTLQVINPIAVCHACEHMQKDCAGPCACLIDAQRRDIMEHDANFQAGNPTCPLKKHGESGAIQPMHPGYLRGLVGIIKSVAWPSDWADKATIAKRRSICRACPCRVEQTGFPSGCNLCGCAIWSKTQLAPEHCPDNPPRW